MLLVQFYIITHWCKLNSPDCWVFNIHNLLVAYGVWSLYYVVDKVGLEAYIVTRLNQEPM